MVIIVENRKKVIPRNRKNRSKIGGKLSKMNSLYSHRFPNVRVYLKLFLLILMGFRVSTI